jgi:hypothetical protein
MTAAPVRRLALLASLALLPPAPLLLPLAPGVGSGARADTAAARPGDATTCDVRRDRRRLGATYVTSLSVTQVSCTKAKRVVKAFNACRRGNGGAAGRCTSSVQGFRCAERRGAAIPTQYSSRVSCRSGARRVRFAYTQFT